jgi:hypothetical protein
MNEDPTRLMDYGDEPPRRRRPPQHQPRGNLRLVVAVMGAVIFGLLVALLVSCGGGETKTVTETTEITREVPATTSKEKSPAEEEAEGSEEEVEEAEGETGGIEGEETFEGIPEEGEVEEIVPEEEGAIEEIAPEEEGGGVGAE